MTACMTAWMMSPSLPAEEFFSRDFVQQLIRNVSPAVAPFLVAIGLALVLTPLAIWGSWRLGVVAHPRERDIHYRPMPKMGGVALYLAFAAGTLWFERARLLPLVILLGVAVLFFVFDDRFKLPWWVKLGAEAALSLGAILILRDVITFISVPGIGIIHLGLLAAPLTLAWLLGMQNTVNMLDGVDGLAAGVVAIVALTLLIAAITRQQPQVVAASAALAGACAGFLAFNWHPARIFMGDSGSHFLGLAVGLLAIIGVAKVAAVFALAIPVLALAVPIGDTAWAIVRRRRSGIPIAHADTQHIHHQLLDFGLSQPQTCLLFYSATGILGAFGLMLLGHRRILAVAIVLLVVVLSTVLGERLMSADLRLKVPGFQRLVAGRPPSPDLG